MLTWSKLRYGGNDGVRHEVHLSFFEFGGIRQDEHGYGTYPLICADLVGWSHWSTLCVLKYTGQFSIK